MGVEYGLTRQELDAVREAREAAASRRCDVRRRERAELAVARAYGLTKRHEQKAGRTMTIEEHVKAILDYVETRTGRQINRRRIYRLEIGSDGRIEVIIDNSRYPTTVAELGSLDIEFDYIRSRCHPNPFTTLDGAVGARAVEA